MKDDQLDIVTLYRSKLSTPVTQKQVRARSIDLLEGIGNADDSGATSQFVLDEKNESVKDRVNMSLQEIHRLKERNPSAASVYQYFGDRVKRNGEQYVKAIIHGDDIFLNRHGDAAGLLEIIVRTDGSRPSFVVKNGTVDLTSSPVGEWGRMLEKSAPSLMKTFKSIGRIEINGIHVGTGFLVANNLIMTNRHVLQAISLEKDGKLTISPNAMIDFGREYGGAASLHPHTIKSVVFCSRQNISSRNIDHKLLDMVLLTIEPPADVQTLPFLGLSTSADWVDPNNTMVYVIGYPGAPDLRLYSIDMLDHLFGATFGYKHLSPGMVVPGHGTEPWTVSHDASTTGGSSGSVILVRTEEQIAAGIHYGGTFEMPRQNWGHVLGATLSTDIENMISNVSLKECLAAHGLQLPN